MMLPKIRPSSKLGLCPVLFGKATRSSSHVVPMTVLRRPAWRGLTTKALTKSMDLITTNKHLTLVPGTNSLQLAVNSQGAEERPLCILLCWLMAQNKHVLKYARFYLDQGFSCLTVRLSPWQLLWPLTGSQVVSKDIITFLTLNANYQSKIVHGFSVGGYLWGEVLNTLSQNLPKYSPLLNSVRGQIWDSVVDMEGIPTGAPTAMFPNNAFLRKTAEKYIRYHMAKFEDAATKHYVQSSLCYHNTILTAPALFLGSLDDSVGSIQQIRKVADKWEAKGVEVYLKAWDSSPHVSHLHHHPEEYKLEMKAFLEKLHLVPYPEKFAHHLPHNVHASGL